MNREYSQYELFDLRRYLAPEEFGQITEYVNSKYNGKGWQGYASWGVPQNSRLWANFVKEDEILVRASILSVGAPKPQRSTKGFSSYGGSIPKLGHGLSIDEADLLTMQEISAQGSAALSDLMVDRLVYTLDKLIGGIHNELTSMTYQALSTGKVNNADINVDGVPVDLSYRIPSKHIIATAKAWEIAAATPVENMLSAQKYAEDNNIPYDHWEMTKTKYRQLVNHPAVLTLCKARMNILDASHYVLTENEVVTVLHDLGIAPIRVVDEKSAYEVDGVAKQAPESFVTSNIVLCNSGDLFEMKCANSVYVQRAKMGPTVSSAMYSFVESRIAILDMWQESPVKNIIETELWALPVMKNPNHILIVKTSALNDETAPIPTV